MQVILGAGGAIGKDLATELKKYTDKVRLVSRNPLAVNDDDELFPGNLIYPESTEKAIKGAKVAYLTAGLAYNTKTWQKQWPEVMKNVISACKKHKTRLVFFDNIYMYNPEKLSPITEETEVLPSSKKGKVREKIAQMILDEVKTGKLEALIARAADFYGPGINNSILMETVFKNLKAGKRANWFCSISAKHNFTYTPDAAKATALLGNTESAYGQVWHLPTVPAVSMQQWIDTFAKELNVRSKTMVVSRFMVSIMGLFIPIMRELKEMLYQFDRDYEFDSSKFETIFNITPTSMEQGIKQVVKAD
ncbi:MAG TPA: NAD-dependent epimerase/dehydratase family protein [Draconibacterium sp.]|nr:NAD-dependent epimerase/dehydratase family protein [Draconibacterium sp.]